MRLGALVAVAVLAGLPGCSPRSNAPFNAAAWAEADYMGQDRNFLADGLLRRGDLIGKTRAEVVALLGEPPPTSYFSDWDMVYILGNERGWMAVDSEWLVLRLVDDQVTTARIVRD